MEAKTASHRSAETRHSRTVRWVINQFEAVKERVEARAGAFVDKEQAWPEEAYDRGRPVAVRKRISAWMEQSELWPAESSHDEPTEAELLMIGDTPVVEDNVCVEEIIEEDVVEEVVSRAKRERRKIMPVMKPVVMAEKSRSVRVNQIARFLKLNGAVDVPKPNGIYFDFPGHGHFQSLHLWKDSPEIQEFSPNQF